MMRGKYFFIMIALIAVTAVQAQITKNPGYQYKEDKSIEILEVELKTALTIVKMRHTAKFDGQGIRMANTKIVADGIDYPLKEAYDVPLFPDDYYYHQKMGDQLTFTLFFKRIPAGITTFDLIEEGCQSCENFKGVQITNPEGSTNADDDMALMAVQLALNKAEDDFENAGGYQDASKTATGNPYENTFRSMREAKKLALKIEDPLMRLVAVYSVSDKYAEFAKRAFVFTHKSQFITEACQELTQLASTVPQLRSSLGSMSPAKLRSEAYKAIAESWREITKAALWGNHQYNKMYCDQQSKKYYELALNEDRSNKELAKEVEKINAPKKPVPTLVQQTPEIPPAIWNDAQTISQNMDDESTIVMEEPQVNYSQLCDMSLDIKSGTVHIKRNGAANWERITDNYEIIFEGDEIKTSNDAKGVSITFAVDNTFMVVKPGSKVRFKAGGMVIWHGSLLLDVTKRGREFVVISETAVTGCRGTKFEVTVNKDKTSETFLYEGVVEVRNENDVAYLTPGEKTVSRKGETQLEQKNFNTSQRQTQQWSNVEQQKQQHYQAIAANAGTTNNNVTPNTGGTSGVTTDFWSIQTFSTDLNQFSNEITEFAERGFIPVGLDVTNSGFEVLLLGGGLLNISSWNMEWYADVNALQEGITTNMNQGWLPTGFSWSGSAFYVFYVMADFQGVAWQIIPSAIDLQAMAGAIQPYVNEGYMPMDVTIAGEELYTLLVQFTDPIANSWNIEGYLDDKATIQEAVLVNLQQNSVPWGILKADGAASILYIGL